jgi:hypothetical protein
LSKATVRYRQNQLGLLAPRMAQRAKARQRIDPAEAEIARLLASGKTAAEIIESTRHSRNKVERISKPLRIRLMRAGAQALGYLPPSQEPQR